jgi:non-specific serine/threonine protein kinase
MAEGHPTAFLSYSHESEEHTARVSALAARLWDNGIDIKIDLDEPSPPSGWPTWMHQQIATCDFTLVICTPTYRARFERLEPLEAGAGVAWEGAIITLDLYEHYLENTRFIPVLLGSESQEAVPVVLRGVSRYRADVDREFELLYARLQNIPLTTRPPIGELRPPRLSTRPAYESYILPEWDLSSKGLGGRDSQTNLPTAPTEFIGRASELERTRGNVLANRVVTLTGQGGTGKTRLALATAQTLVDEFADGVWWVDLASLADAREIPHEISQVVGIFQQPEQAEMISVVQALRRSHLLLVFDNCERHTMHVARVIDQLTNACHELHVLATSRETLGAEAELPQPLPPLRTPDPVDATTGSVQSSDGGALFLNRAVSVDASFVLDERQDATLIAEICRAVHGVPLAIELAAGALAYRSLPEVAAGLNDAMGLVGATDRQRALETTIGWCSRLLADDERDLLVRLSVFDGAFEETAVGAICGDGDDGTAARFAALQKIAFVSPALVSDVANADGLPPRFQLLESVRHFARQRSVDEETRIPLKDRHAAFFLQRAEESRPQLRQHDQRIWLRTLEADHDDLRAAISWFRRSGDVEGAMRLAGALGRFWHMRGYWHEGRRLLREILAMDGAARHPAARGLALVAKGHLAFVSGDFISSKTFFEESLAVREQLGDPTGIADSLHRVGCVAEVLSDFGRAWDHQDRALALARELGNRELEADVLHHLGVLAGIDGLDDEAESFHLESLRLRRLQGDQWGEAWSLVVLGNHYRLTSRLEEAEECYAESLELYEEQGDRRRIASVLICMADVSTLRRQLESARELLERATRLVHDLGDLRGIVETIETWAVFHAAREEPERCFTLLGAADALRDEIGATRTPLAQNWLNQSMRHLTTPVSERLEWQSAGHRLHPRDALALAQRRTNDGA